MEDNKNEEENTYTIDYDRSSFSFSYRYPFTNSETKFEPILVGTASFIFSALLLPFIFILGYLNRLILYTANGEPECPRFNNFKLLTKEGGLMLALIISIIGFQTGANQLFLYLFGQESIYTTLVLIIIFYISPSVITVFSVGELYDEPLEFVKEIFRFAFSLTYIFGFFVFILGQLAFVISFFGVTIITLSFGLLFFTVLYFFACATFWGHRYYVWDKKRSKKKQ